MATVKMKYALVCGAREMRGKALEVLLDFGALELQRLSPVTGMRAQRQALIKLYQQVRDYQNLALPQVPPSSEPQDLVGLATRLLEETEALERTQNELLAATERQQLWGKASPLQLTELAGEGVYVQCWRTDDMENLDLLKQQGGLLWQGKRERKQHEVVFFTLSRGQALALDWASNLAPPDQDPTYLHTEISRLQARLESLQGGLRWLACERIDDFGAQVAAQIDVLSIEAGRIQSHADDHVFVLSGWIPVNRLDEVGERLRELPGVNGSFRDPLPGEDPPTLTEYPAWIRPIQSIFEFMGYRPGYDEYDAGHLIIVFFTVFSALLINDGGYGLLMFGILAFGYRRISRLLGVGAVQLGLYVAGATAVWGLLSGSFFGVQLGPLTGIHFLSLDTDDMIKLSFGLGIFHLSVGRLIHMWRLGWTSKMVAELGWLAMLWAIFLGIFNVFTGKPVPAISGPLLGLGALLVIFCSRLELGVARGTLMGTGLLLGNATSLFSDMMSYIRIMAVGFASMSLAMTTNLMAEQTGSYFFGALILLIGHSINLGLGVIALFVHGLRLNTLEFARQLGVIWSGRAFEPMARFQLESIEEP
jgi:V/A-type H+-transporting ATPase subunit I